MKRSLLLAALCAALVATPAAAVSISDGDFSTWTFGSFASGGGTATATRETTDGNPGARFNVTTITGSGQTAFGTALNPTQFSEALEDVPFTLSLDVLSGTGAFGAGQAILLLVEQGGSIYSLSLNTTGVQATFMTLLFPGTLDSASFGKVSGGGPATPNFDGSVATRFGFAAGNSESGTLTQ